MLKSLKIDNFALIDHLEIALANGFSVITGETGTGKSVFLGAISMMLGQRSDAKMVREGAARCIIEGVFDLSGYNLQPFFEAADLDYDECECIVRREVSSAGRSRAFINDTPVTVAQLRELGAALIDIHSQHQNLLLGDRNFQLNVLDTLGRGDKELREYGALYDEYRAVRARLERLRDELEKSRRDEDFVRFQLEEIDALSLREGEQEELEQEQTQLSHAEDIQAALCGALAIIDGEGERSLVRAVREAATALARVSAHYPAASELSERLETNYIELKDCCSELSHRAEEVVFSPERLEFVDRRLSAIYDLQKKHRVGSTEELLGLAEAMRERLQHIEGGDEEIAALEKKLATVTRSATEAAARLTARRREAAQMLQEKITAILVTLGMPLIRFGVHFEASSDFTPQGTDVVRFLFSANSISPMQPLSEVASGGEMARVMLALKSLIADSVQQPTLIFDEIDTGISGVLAERMGRLMWQMGSIDHQVISITHLPQVAALGTAHYKVYKEEGADGTKTRIVELCGEARVREIAQMMSGEKLTEAALDNARLLLSGVN